MVRKLTTTSPVERRFLTAAAVLIVVVVAGALGWRLVTPKREARTIRVAVVESAYYLPLIVAADQHLFERHGFKATVTVFNNNNDMMNALIKKDADVSGLGSGGAFALEAASPGVMRFIYGQNNRSYPLLVKSDSTIKNLVELRGRRIGTWPSPTPKVLLHLMLDDRLGKDTFEIDPSDARFHAQTLEHGDVQALFTYDIFAQQALDSGRARVLSKIPVEEYIMKPFFNGGGLVRRDLATTDPEMYAAIIAAVEESIKFIRDHEDEARRSLVTHFKVTEAVARDCPIDEFMPLSDVNIAQAQAVADLMYRQKITTAKADAASMFH